jgi:hypothetical protein
MSDQWVAPFANRMVVWDQFAKEPVMITNGTCIHDHSSPEAFKLAHPDNAPCKFTPCEGVVVRVISACEGVPFIAWTYRKIRAGDLKVIPGTKLPMNLDDLPRI